MKVLERFDLESLPKSNKVEGVRKYLTRKRSSTGSEAKHHLEFKLRRREEWSGVSECESINDVGLHMEFKRLLTLRVGAERSRACRIFTNDEGLLRIRCADDAELCRAIVSVVDAL